MQSILELTKIATQSQTQPINIYREYCQHIFLNYLYQHSNSDQFLFKGGTALRIVYASPRYSEDLDFTILQLSNRQIEDTVLFVLEQMRKINLEVELLESKKTTGGYIGLFKVKVEDIVVNIEINGSKRVKNANKDLVLIDNLFIPSYTLNILSETDLIVEKFTATLTRSKPRDFFDIYFLLRKGIIKEDLRSQLGQLEKLLKDKDINFEKELSMFLPQNIQGIARNFNKVFLQEISKYTRRK